jgi:hypothetical protein
MQRKHIISVTVGITLMAAVFAAAYFYTDMKLKLPKANGNVVSKGSSTTDASPAEVDEKEIVQQIHFMSNTLIKAGDNQVWGTEEVNKASIDKVLRMLDQAPLNARTEELREIVARWQQGDFSQIVDDHNYVWHLLGGTVGFAKSANDKAVSDAIANLKDTGE